MGLTDKKKTTDIGEPEFEFREAQVLLRNNAIEKIIIGE